MGPGLTTGACNDDPSSVGTYSQVGAQFGYGLAWTLFFSFPLLVAVQEISARMARVTGCGLAGNLRRHCPKWLAAALIALLTAANVFNLAADLGAMGAVLRLLIAAPALLYVCMLGAASVLIELLTRQARYVRILRWLSLSLLSYVVCAFVLEVPWREMASSLLSPPLSASPPYVLAVLAALGTTISPYLLFWQAQQEVEEIQLNGSAPRLLQAIEQAPGEFARIRFDTLIGMGLFMLFALGIMGAGLLTLPALSSSTAYAVGELLSWRVGRRHPRRHAPAFYAAIAGATALAVALNFTGLNPMRALYWSAALNGVIAVPLLAALMYLATNTEVMGPLQLPAGLRVFGWLAAGAMACSPAGLAIAWLRYS
ncbi:MAG TPA: divalent metal cation transporter [Steroidobacteraceae bacterium]